MFNNISCIQFKQNINKIISTCELPPLVAFFILKDTMNELEKICEKVLQKQVKGEDQKHMEAHINPQTGQFEQYEIKQNKEQEEA